MFIKKLSPGVYDVFIGNGWDNWTRVRRGGADGLSVIAGKDLNRAVLNKVKGRIFR